MIYEKMCRFTYNTGNGSTFTTVANFGSHSEQDLALQINDHIGKYGVISYEEIDPSELTFEDLAED